jgi:hypothetical protein
MKSLILMLLGGTAVLACSKEADRRPPIAEDLTLPVEEARRDTSPEAVSPVEQHVARSEARTETPTRSPERPKLAAAPAPDTASVQPDTTSVQGYAPDAGADSPADSAPLPDSSAADLDTVPEVVSDSVLDPAATDLETTPEVVSDSVTAPDPAPAPPEPVPAPAAPAPSRSTTAAARTLPIGTEIRVALDDSINSRHDTAGRMVTAHVMENVLGPTGLPLIEAGAPVRLTITKLEPAKKKSAAGGKLAFRVDGIGVGGQLQKVKADVKPVPHELQGRGVTAEDAAKVGVGAAGGAVLGRVLGGNTRGAVIGGVVGAAGGAVVAAETASRDVVVKAKTPVVFVLTEPMVASAGR